MSNYRRLISYIYAYEGGVKGKNIGYAKVEIRGEQCRIHVNVKKIYVGSNDVGVYLLAPGTEIPLGKVFIRGGVGEFRISVQSGDVEGSGQSMDDCYGLTVHDVESTWQCYTTIWEDAVAQAAEIQLADVTAENVRAKEELERITEIQSAEIVADSRFPVSEEIERELEEEERRMAIVAPWETNETENEAGKTNEKEMHGEVPAKARTEPLAEEIQPAITESIKIMDIKTRLPQSKMTETDFHNRKPEPQIPEPELPEMNLTEMNLPEPKVPEPGDPAKLEALDRMEQEEHVQKDLWNRLGNRYAKVLAFDYDNGCEILSIKPQDIGVLPREIWIYGNNSFLLHGYYNYRHLILARLNNPKGAPRYLLGVPGHYFSNEKHMASMFGFPHFVLAKRQPEADGRFGYWYTDIRL